jgi:Fic family protein
MKSLDPLFLLKLKVDPHLTSLVQALGESKGRQQLFARQAPEVLETLRLAALVESTESSNRLEGIVTTHARIESIVLKSATPRNRHENEIAGYRDVLAMIHESWKAMPLDLNVMLQFHSMLYRKVDGRGGSWKNADNTIVEHLPTGGTRVRFRPVSALQTPVSMQKLMENYHYAIGESFPNLLMLPLFILDFLCIHPFNDGNGRVSRLLTLLLAYQEGYEVGRYISLERVTEDTKEGYYRTLQTSSQGWHEGTHDVYPWVEYFLTVLLRAYQEFEERVEKIRDGRGSKTQLIKNVILRKNVPFTFGELRRECPEVSPDWIKVVLNQLKTEGKVQVKGRGPGAKWSKVFK